MMITTKEMHHHSFCVFLLLLVAAASSPRCTTSSLLLLQPPLQRRGRRRALFRPTPSSKSSCGPSPGEGSQLFLSTHGGSGSSSSSGGTEIEKRLSRPDAGTSSARKTPAAFSRDPQDEARRLKAQAEALRLEAERMDMALTLEKIAGLEAKLGDPRWVRRRRAEAAAAAKKGGGKNEEGGGVENGKGEDVRESLERQLEALRKKLSGDGSPAVAGVTTIGGGSSSGDGTRATSSPEGAVTSDLSSSLPAATMGSKPGDGESGDRKKDEDDSHHSTKSEATESETPLSSSPPVSVVGGQQQQQQKNPASSSSLRAESKLNVTLCGFDKEDLDLFLPVALDIEECMANETIEEKLAAFRRAPSLQDHFQRKIRALLVQPLKDLQKLSELKQGYLETSSRVERDQIRREIKQLEKSITQNEKSNENEYGIFDISETSLGGCQAIPPISGAEMDERLQALKALPPVLQELYKRRSGVTREGEEVDEKDVSDSEGRLRLAIQIDYYEGQLELLEKVRYLAPLDDEQRARALEVIESLPMSVRQFFAKKNLGLENCEDANRIIEELESGNESDPTWNSLKVVMEAGSDLPSEYDDIDFLDRSRYMEEFHPAVARLEDLHPNVSDVDTFVSEVLGRKTYMVNSKPERVIGGYYLRGENVITDDEDGTELVHRIRQNLDKSSVKNKIDFFYLPDPSPMSDEEVELGYNDQALILLTTKNNTALFQSAGLLSKIGISSLGFLSVAVFATGTCILQPLALDRIQAALAAGSVDDVNAFFDRATFVTGLIIAIQALHEAAHRIVALKDKFEVDLPTIVPSVQTGTFGAITPIKSPPPSLKSLFDFSLAGPLTGLVASVALLTAGLSITASLDINQTVDLPALPMFLLRSSTLGGSLIELFLGKGALMRDLPGETVLPLHPLAVAGFVGVLSNSLALLPLGNTDGGRICVAMFGRRGAFIVKFFTGILLCVTGLLGFDEASILLTYSLYTFIWQRELEAPCRNEVEELDFARAALAIASALLVTVALVPLP